MHEPCANCALWTTGSGGVDGTANVSWLRQNWQWLSALLSSMSAWLWWCPTPIILLGERSGLASYIYHARRPPTPVIAMEIEYTNSTPKCVQARAHLLQHSMRAASHRHCTQEEARPTWEEDQGAEATQGSCHGQSTGSEFSAADQGQQAGQEISQENGDEGLVGQQQRQKGPMIVCYTQAA